MRLWLAPASALRTSESWPASGHSISGSRRGPGRDTLRHFGEWARSRCWRQYRTSVCSSQTLSCASLRRCIGTSSSAVAITAPHAGHPAPPRFVPQSSGASAAELPLCRSWLCGHARSVYGYMRRVQASMMRCELQQTSQEG